jgi:hypothetical protein
MKSSGCGNCDAGSSKPRGGWMYAALVAIVQHDDRFSGMTPVSTI